MDGFFTAVSVVGAVGKATFNALGEQVYSNPFCADVRPKNDSERRLSQEQVSLSPNLSPSLEIVQEYSSSDDQR